LTRATTVEGAIIEDRGNLGVGGERLYRVRFRVDEITDPIENNYPADELSLVAKAPSTPRTRR
jgi:hypothetical protein